MGTVCGEGCERYLGISILELVLRQLRSAGFKADAAFPGQKYPQIKEPVAAVHIEKVDQANLTVTLEVSIICPAAYGGTACEVEALRATQVLQWDGAVCIQNGCSYDGTAQVYVVSILATYTCVTERDDCTLGPGFQVYIGEIYQPFAVSFTDVETAAHQAEYEIGESLPVGISLGNNCWEITLEEQIPPGSPETEEPEGPFKLQVLKNGKTEVYYHCRWLRIERMRTRSGLRRVRKGICMEKEVK